MLVFDPAQDPFLTTTTSRSSPEGSSSKSLLTAALSQKVPGFPGIPFFPPPQTSPPHLHIPSSEHCINAPFYCMLLMTHLQILPLSN